MAIKPGKYDPLKPDIELFDYKTKKRYGLKLEGSGALQVGTISQDDSVYVRSVGKRVGDFDEQRSWKGGRGIDKLSENAEAFWDSMNAWTLSEGHLHQTLLWEFARGLRACDFEMPSRDTSLGWYQLYGASLYMNTPFVASSSFTADYVRLWIRRVGTPGTLTLELRSGAGVLETLTTDTTEITDTVSVLHKFLTASGVALTSGTTYYVRLIGSANDNKNNHWEVGGDPRPSVGNSGVSADGLGAFDAIAFSAYYYVADADINRKWFAFFLDSAMYLVDSKDDQSTASKVYINGDRGKATSGTATQIADTGKAWTVDRWAGAWVRIVRGTGAGQSREILSNTATAINVTTAFDTTPDNTSEYIIYATQWFTEVATSGLGVVKNQPAVVNQIVYFPQGSLVNTRRMIWSGTAHVFSDDGTNKYAFLIPTIDPSDTRVWGLNNNPTTSGGAKTIAFAKAAAWANPPAALAFSTAKNVGDATYGITGVVEKDRNVYIFKEDGIWICDYSVNLVKLASGAEKTPSSVNGLGSIAHQQFVYFSWLHSLIRIYGATLDDIGQDWSGYGLPDGREGSFSSLDSYTSLLFAGVDAGVSGTSSVLGWDGVGWHEMIRAHDVGARIRLVKIQTCPETRNRTWVDMGGDFVFQEMPLRKGTPRLDSGARYMHEAVIESCAIDMGTASALPKFIKELVVSCKNLGGGNEVFVDYQTDDDVHTSNWTNATTLYESPESAAFLGLSNIRKFAYRLRICSNDNTAPVDIQGVIPNGYARSPYKMVWTLRCRADNVQSRGRFVKPDVLMRWLLDNARFPGRLEMRSQYELAHKFFVIVHPPRMFPYKPSQNGQAEESVFTIVLEEA